MLIAGLILQLASIMVAFMTYFRFMRRVVQNRNFLDPRFSDIYLSARYKTATLCTFPPSIDEQDLRSTDLVLVEGIQIALAFLLIRTVARVAQLFSGLDSSLSQSQTYLPLLDGALVLLAVTGITIMSPGVAFGRAWGVTSPSNTKARRHSAALYPAQRNSGSSLRHLHGRSISSPQAHPYNNHHHQQKEPRSPPPTVTAHSTDAEGPAAAAGSSRRYSPTWTAQRRPQQQQQQQPARPAQLPPYERPVQNYTRVPYVPPQPGSLSQQYGHGTVVESHVVVGGGGGGDGARAGAAGPSGRARQSPRAYEDDLVRHDSIW